VGKIGIQDSILGKAGPLTDEEFAVMKTHPTKGAAIMEHVPQLKSMIPGMKYHHENVDGSGYPEGLKGDQIPLIAKIVSVADTFDAMTTNRPYQKAMEITYVFTRMRSFIGKKFEKHLVEALITAYEEGLIRPNMKVESVLKPAAAPAPAPGARETLDLPAPAIVREPVSVAASAFRPPPPPIPPPPLPTARSAAPAAAPVAVAPPRAPVGGASTRGEETHGVGPPPALMDRLR
jgi:hypothetical protein